MIFAGYLGFFIGVAFAAALMKLAERWRRQHVRAMAACLRELAGTCPAQCRDGHVQDVFGVTWPCYARAHHQHAHVLEAAAKMLEGT